MLEDLASLDHEVLCQSLTYQPKRVAAAALP